MVKIALTTQNFKFLINNNIIQERSNLVELSTGKTIKTNKNKIKKLLKNNPKDDELSFLVLNLKEQNND